MTKCPYIARKVITREPYLIGFKAMWLALEKGGQRLGLKDPDLMESPLRVLDKPSGETNDRFDEICTASSFLQDSGEPGCLGTGLNDRVPIESEAVSQELGAVKSNARISTLGLAPSLGLYRVCASRSENHVVHIEATRGDVVENFISLDAKPFKVLTDRFLTFRRQLEIAHLGKVSFHPPR